MNDLSKTFQVDERVPCSFYFGFCLLLTIIKKKKKSQFSSSNPYLRDDKLDRRVLNKFKPSESN